MTTIESEIAVAKRFRSLVDVYDQRPALARRNILPTMIRFLRGTDRELRRLALESLFLLAQHPINVVLLSQNDTLVRYVQEIYQDSAMDDPEVHTISAELYRLLFSRSSTAGLGRGGGTTTIGGVANANGGSSSGAPAAAAVALPVADAAVAGAGGPGGNAGSAAALEAGRSPPPLLPDTAAAMVDVALHTSAAAVGHAPLSASSSSFVVAPPHRYPPPIDALHRQEVQHPRRPPPDGVHEPPPPPLQRRPEEDVDEDEKSDVWDQLRDHPLAVNNGNEIIDVEDLKEEEEEENDDSIALPTPRTSAVLADAAATGLSLTRAATALSSREGSHTGGADARHNSAVGYQRATKKCGEKMGSLHARIQQQQEQEEEEDDTGQSPLHSSSQTRSQPPKNRIGKGETSRGGGPSPQHHHSGYYGSAAPAAPSPPPSYLSHRSATHVSGAGLDSPHMVTYDVPHLYPRTSTVALEHVLQTTKGVISYHLYPTQHQIRVYMICKPQLIQQALEQQADLRSTIIQDEILLITSVRAPSPAFERQHHHLGRTIATKLSGTADKWHWRGKAQRREEGSEITASLSPPPELLPEITGFRLFFDPTETRRASRWSLTRVFLQQFFQTILVYCSPSKSTLEARVEWQREAAAMEHEIDNMGGAATRIGERWGKWVSSFW